MIQGTSVVSLHDRWRAAPWATEFVTLPMLMTRMELAGNGDGGKRKHVRDGRSEAHAAALVRNDQAKDLAVRP